MGIIAHFSYTSHASHNHFSLCNTCAFSLVCLFCARLNSFLVRSWMRNRKFAGCGVIVPISLATLISVLQYKLIRPYQINYLFIILEMEKNGESGSILFFYFLCFCHCLATTDFKLMSCHYKSSHASIRSIKN